MENIFITLKFFVVLILLAFIFPRPVIMGQKAPSEYVNLLIGTATFEDEEYLGNTPPDGFYSYYGCVIPGPHTPTGLVMLSPITSFSGFNHARGSGYRHTDSTIMGFVHLSHQYSRNANISFMPMIGDLEISPGSLEEPDTGYRSRKNFKSEIAKPNYYSVLLEDYNTKAEFTVTDNVGFHRYTFPSTDKARILIDLSISQDNVEYAHVSVEDSMHVSGWQKCGTYTVYFYSEFDKPFASYGTWKDEDIYPGNGEQTGKKVGGFFEYRISDENEVQVKVGISLRSIQDAKMKLNEEIPGWNFDKISTETENRWNNLLSRIKVEGGTENQKTLFYTSLCRCFYGRHNVVNGLIPTILIQQLVRPEWFNGYMRDLKWNSGDIGGFWGLGSASAILGIYRRGITNFDLEAAYEAYCTTENSRRRKIREYNKWGYIPYTEYNKNEEQFLYADVVNRTLGYAYTDYCIAKIAKILGKNEDYTYFMKSSNNYRNLFDSETGFFRAKDASGEWWSKEQFDPAKPYWIRFYREGNAWQWLWLVPHNLNDLIQLLGGKDKFVNKLDDFFAIPYDPKETEGIFNDTYRVSGYKGVVDVTGMIGQYCHGNETDRFVPYYYTFVGQSWKTQKIVRKIIDKLYKAKPGGLCGMDDYGGLSSWYVFSSMGFYPVRPELPVYNIGSPIFEKITIDVDKRGKFVIEAKNVSEKNKYIQSATLNGETHNKSWFEHSALLKGGKLVLQMGSTPNKEWSSASAAAPPSMFNAD